MPLKLLRPILGSVIALALPPRCPGCGAVVAADHRFCVACWTSLHFLGPPWCERCHLPFEHDRDELCPDCRADPPRHAGVDAAVAYGPVARTVALRLKYGGRAAFAETVARLMARHLPPGAEVIVPVPLHRRRLWSRGYNQAALIAHALGRSRKLPVAASALVRQRATPVLRGLGAEGRRKAVRGAFCLAASADLAGRHVVLVDDVHTSGATAAACTETLLGGGAARVSVLCWARVLNPDAAD